MPHELNDGHQPADTRFEALAVAEIENMVFLDYDTI
jgi:hypothetical protein